MSPDEFRVPKPEKDGLRRYGRDATNTKGRVEDTSRCVYEVARNHGRWTNFYQCNRKRGHGEGGLFCSLHTAEAIKKRKEDRDRRGVERWERDPGVQLIRVREENARLVREVNKLKKRIEELESKESKS